VAVANEVRWQVALAADMGCMAVLQHTEESDGLATPAVVQWLAGGVFWQGPEGPPGRAATCSHHPEKAVLGTCVLDALEESFGKGFDRLDTDAVGNKPVLEVDVAVRMASADDPL